MLLLLPVLAFLFIFFLISQLSGLLWRERLVVSAVLFCFLLTLITEVLSFFHFLTTLGVVLGWGMAVLGMLGLAGKRKRFAREYFLPEFGNFWVLLKKDLWVKIATLGIFFITISTFILALFSAPNNIDSASFILARPMHWMQNASLSLYQTHITSQIYLPPFAGYAFLQTMILSGGDLYTNLVQWLFSLGTAVCVSLIVYRFKSNLRTQLLAVFVVLTIPVGILQSSSTSEDYILAFFLCAFVYFSLSFERNLKNIYPVLAACSLGLGLLTKYNAYIYFAPFALWFFAKYFLKFDLLGTFRIIFITLVIALFINAGFFWRNYTFSKSPVFSLSDIYVNSPVGLKSFILGSVKNLSVHFSTPIPVLNKVIYTGVKQIHELFGVPLDSLQFNWRGREFVIFKISANEQKAPATFHILLLLFSSVVLFRKKAIFDLKIYLLASFGAFVLFSGLFKWGGSFPRFHLPLFVLGSVPVAIVIGKFRSSTLLLLVVLLLFSSFYFIFFNVNKPVLGPDPFWKKDRMEQYFILKPQLYEPYTQISELVAGNNYKKVGLFMQEFNFDLEYPLWVVIKNLTPDVLIESVDVQNNTKSLGQEFKPDVVVFLKQNKEIAQKYLDFEIPMVGIE